MANVKVEIRPATFVDENGKTISFNTLVLVGVPTTLGPIDIDLMARKKYQSQYLKDYLKLVSQK